MKLFYRTLGEGAPLVILHGLLGSSDNWYTVAKRLATNNTVWLVDQRNHGRSPHSDEHDYALLTEDLWTFIRQHNLQKSAILGHSMGGKTAMNFAVKYAEAQGPLIVVDIAPRRYPILHEKILRGLNAVPLDRLTSRQQVDAALSDYVSDAAVRGFLLKNLTRDSEKKFSWKVNLSALSRHIDRIGDGLRYAGRFDGPVLFVRGSRSDYITLEDKPRIRSVFPHAEIKDVEAGHWVHAENPDAFVAAVTRFLHR